MLPSKEIDLSAKVYIINMLLFLLLNSGFFKGAAPER